MAFTFQRFNVSTFRRSVGEVTPMLRFLTAGESHGKALTELVGSMKFGFEDARRALERASARETAARVAAGTLCRKLLHEFGIEVSSHVVEIGGVAIRTRPEQWDDIPAAAEASELRCVDPAAEEEMRAG